MNNARVIFLKDGFYNNKRYNKDDVINMSVSDIDIYEQCKVVKRYVSKNKNQLKNKQSNTNDKNNLNYKDMNYKDLQKLCSKLNIRAVGTKEELINSLENINKKITV